ncbi:hypothetical protein Clacol_005590 [Clathrus columnatus]|uniref:RING-type E3 ubiquitin transferase n=1 Tax=Clathrus columnatus TaxID=1419009 RepID=A0AAV5AD08_9AGAM|nr:hypothetical protein Clacol_005590 [Clathrus columnatus]
MPRPNVSPRPVCRYYNTSRGCFAGEKCHYLHGDPSVQKYAPYEENKTCRYFSQGFCKRGRECWYKHIEPKVGESSTSTTTSQHSSSGSKQKLSEQESSEDEDLACGICFEEKPAIYGLLSGCSHAFCLACIRRWRDPEGKGVDLTESGMHKTCPMCRTKSKFVVPSSIFYLQDDSRKLAVVENYKQSMARVPCRYFVNSKLEQRFCPFGKDCFYQHANEDGTPYIFTEGVDVMMHRRRRHMGISPTDDSDADPLQSALDALEGFVGSLMENNTEEHQPSNSTVEVNVESNANSESNETRTCREVLNLHLGQMMRTMGHGCFGTGMTPSSAIDLEALLAETTPSEDEEEPDWDDEEPFVVYTGDLNASDADDEDDEDEESDSYWDDLLDVSPVPVAPITHSPLPLEEEDDYGYYEAFMDGAAHESESETEESEVETELEDIAMPNVSASAVCFDAVDEQWNSSLVDGEIIRLLEPRW